MPYIYFGKSEWKPFPDFSVSYQYGCYIFAMDFWVTVGQQIKKNAALLLVSLQIVLSN